MRRLLVPVLLMALFAITNPSAIAQEMPGPGETRYISPQFGYGLAWDDAWHTERSLSRPGFDALVLSNDTSQVALSATTGFAGATGLMASPEQCAHASLKALMTQPGTKAAVRQDGAGAPVQADDGELFWMEVTYRAVDGTPMIAYVSCRALGLRNGAMQTFLHVAPEPSYAAQSAAVDALLETYTAPTLDLDQLDQGTRPEPAP